MQNQPEYFDSLKSDIKKFGKIIRQATSTVLDQDVSNYPVFVVSKEEIQLGIPILDNEISGSNWSFNLTTLEELVTKGIIDRERRENFKKIYKNPNKFVCLFVWINEAANFVFAPYELV